MDIRYIVVIASAILGFLGHIIVRKIENKLRFYLIWVLIIYSITISSIFIIEVNPNNIIMTLFNYYIANSNIVLLTLYIINLILLISNNLFYSYKKMVFSEIAVLQSILNTILVFWYGIVLEGIILREYIYMLSFIALISLAIIWPQIEILGIMDKKNKYWWLTGKIRDFQ